MKENDLEFQEERSGGLHPSAIIGILALVLIVGSIVSYRKTIASWFDKKPKIEVITEDCFAKTPEGYTLRYSKGLGSYIVSTSNNVYGRLQYLYTGLDGQPDLTFLGIHSPKEFKDSCSAKRYLMKYINRQYK